MAKINIELEQKRYKKFTVNTPITHCEQVRQAIGQSGGGKIGGYSHCSFSVRGTGRCLPDENAKPFLGTANQLELIEEEQIESFCKKEDLAQVIAAIRKAHPYEEPVITVWDVEIY